MNWLNIIVLAVFVFCIMNGIRRGFIRTAAAMASFFVSMALVYLLNPYVTDFLEQKTPVYEMVEEKCTEAVTAGLEGQMKEQGESVVMEDLPLPESLKEVLLKNGTDYKDSLVESFAGYLSSSITHIIVSTISFLITLALVSLIFRIMVSVLDGIFSLPVLSLFNRMAGAAAGCVQGLLIVWVFFLIVTLCFDTSWGRQAVEMAQANPVTKWLYDSNLLLKFISGFLTV